MGITTINDITSQLAKEIQEEIDFEIIAEILSNAGWKTMEVEDHKKKHAEGMAEWLDQNCKGKWKYGFNKVLFELQEDAVWFALTWK